MAVFLFLFIFLVSCQILPEYHYFDPEHCSTKNNLYLGHMEIQLKMVLDLAFGGSSVCKF